MDMFVKFNRNKIQDRQLDTLIGLSKGLIADGKVNQAEAECLMVWLIQSCQNSDHPIIINLLKKVKLMLEDGVLDKDESFELFSILSKLTGDKSEIGELAKTTNLPIDTPLPNIEFVDKLFLFTGTFAFGNRSQCKEVTKSLGGMPVKSVTKSLDYLVLGKYVTDSWVHENFGRKIEKAMQYRENGAPLAIITEEHWVNSGNI